VRDGDGGLLTLGARGIARYDEQDGGKDGGEGGIGGGGGGNERSDVAMVGRPFPDLGWTGPPGPEGATYLLRFLLLPSHCGSVG
jgi:hypothetical protein